MFLGGLFRRLAGLRSSARFVNFVIFPFLAAEFNFGPFGLFIAARFLIQPAVSGPIKRKREERESGLMYVCACVCMGVRVCVLVCACTCVRGYACMCVCVCSFVQMERKDIIKTKLKLFSLSPSPSM